MKLEFPIKDFIITQGFGANANPSYAGDGLKGHTGIDFVSKYDAPIYAAIKAEVYSIINKDHPDPMKYRAVFQIYDDVDFSYEISYGHCNCIICKEETTYDVGEQLATIGNTGTCYSNGRLVTREEKLGGSQAGHHLHFQVRKLKRVSKRNSKNMYVRNSEGHLKRNGFFYEVVDYNNGYNGCIDPMPFLRPRPLYQFTKNLSYKQVDLDVMKLQEVLKDYGTFTGDEITAFYGEETRKAVFAFQLAEKVASPIVLWANRGKFCHEATRRRLNELYSHNQ